MEQMLEAEKALQAIKHGLVRGRWQRGEALTIRDVAAELGLGMTPVRDAFNELVAQGVLEQRAGVGTRVANPRLERLAQLCKLRAVLEGLAASWLAEKASKVTLAALAAEAEVVDELMLGVDFTKNMARLYEAEDHFHRHFVEYAGSPDLLIAWKPCHFLLLMPGPAQGVLGLYGPGITAQRHELVMAAVATGDPDLAERTVRQHVVGVDEGLIRYLKELAQQADVGVNSGRQNLAKEEDKSCTPRHRWDGRQSFVE